MAPRLQLAAAAGSLAGRPLRHAIDEIDRFPALAEADPVITAPRRWAIRARSFTMRLREKGKKDAEPVSMGWDEAQAALQAGTHEVADEAGSGTEKPREGEGGDAPDDLDTKTKAELEALAKERGVDISAAKTKADLVEALRKA